MKLNNMISIVSKIKIILFDVLIFKDEIDYFIDNIFKRFHIGTSEILCYYI